MKVKQLKLCTMWLALAAFLCGAVWLLAAEKAAPPPAAAEGAKPTDPAEQRITVKLVTDFDSGKLVSDVEEFRPITETTFGKEGSFTLTLGEEAILWVRNAHVDGKFFFERYYQGKYIGRQSQLEITLKELGPGEHLLQPGNHKFAVDDAGRITSADPDMRVVENTLMLRLHRVTVYSVDGARTGPPEFRKLAADIGLFALNPEAKLDPAKLPDPRHSFDPLLHSRTIKDAPPPPPLSSVLSDQKKFFPLHVWLPANQAGNGYVLYPSWQAFHLTPEGKIDLKGSAAPAVAGVTAEADSIVLPYRKFTGIITAGSRLSAGVAGEAIKPPRPNQGPQQLQLGATLESLKFRAGVGTPPEDFFLRVDNDFSHRPFKSFVADNSTDDPAAVRLMAVEWDAPVFTRGADSAISLRILETTGKETLKNPEARLDVSVYFPSLPSYRLWKPVQVLGWQNGREDGVLRFKAPDQAPGFCVIRVQVFEKGDTRSSSALAAEIETYISEPGQQGTASVVSQKARTAFVAGETIALQVVFRSAKPRPAGARTVVLKSPDGHEEKLTVQDSGGEWVSCPIILKGEQTRQMQSGRYTLDIRDLPQGIVAAPFIFDLASRDKTSLFTIVKPSKYTKPMNALETSHLQDEPVDLDRAVDTLAEMGYNRMDLMTYVTNHHLRAYTWREELSSSDPRLPAPDSVYTPTPRDQILNACVREQLQFSDVWLTYNDFYLPRYIDPYISACERWLGREVQAMRHSPAWDGTMLYDEMYNNAAVAIVPSHPVLFGRIRAKLATDVIGKSPSQIEGGFSKYLQRPRDQRDPEVLQTMLKYRNWEQHGWGDFISRVVKAGKSIAPQARFGTYHRTWLTPGSNDDSYNGYPPDLFKNLDIVSHVHYADNSTCWVSIPLLAQALTRNDGKLMYINMPLTHEFRTEWDGQYQRQMAFAMLAQGVTGISQWGLPLSFDDGANDGTLRSRETTRHLNRGILQPFGEVISRSRDAYRKIGIVSTVNQHSLSQFKELPVASQTEGLWIACWRLGYPAVFLREDDFDRKLEGYSVIFVPGIRFAGELDEKIEKRLREAQAAGTRVVVEQGSTFEMPGVTRMEDEPLTSYFLGNYFPTWYDDELKKVYEKSQPITDHLKVKFAEWDVEPSARGDFKVGPNWRTGGDINYLVMANFDDPDYQHAVKQQMAKPVQVALQVPGHYGNVAYDLLAAAETPVTVGKDAKGRPENTVTADMRRMQGALLAFLPEHPAKLKITYRTVTAPSMLHLEGQLIGDSGKVINGIFPVRIEFDPGPGVRVFHRVLGADSAVDLDLPLGATERTCNVNIRETISGKTATFAIKLPALTGGVMAVVPPTSVSVPYPDEVRSFMTGNKKVTIIPAPAIKDAATVAQELARRLKEKGIDAQIVEEKRAFHLPNGNPEQEDPLMDGFHSWRYGQEIIGPATVVDSPAILLGGRNSSFLMDTLATYGFLPEPPIGGPGLAVRPSVQVAHKSLHFAYDTLCLIANDGDGLRRCVDQLFTDLPAVANIAKPAYGAPVTVQSADAPPAATPPASAYSTNELVKDLQFDKAGNAYVITWGHGKNLYSIAPDGKLRFSLFLPEMGANRLQVGDDRVLVHTSAGARVYQIALDGKPISQVRLNRDPGTIWDDEYELAQTDFEYLPDRRQILHNSDDRMRLLDTDANVVAEWTGEAFTDKDVSDEVMHRETGQYLLSPDRKVLAQIEVSHYFTSDGDKKDVKVFDGHLVLRDFTGKLLYEYKNIDNGKEITARMAWPEGAPGPVVYVKHERLAFDGQLKLLSRTPCDAGEYSLGDDRRLVRDGRMLAYYDTPTHVQCNVGPFEIMPTLVELSADRQMLAFMDEYGQVSVFRTADGSAVSRFPVQELGRILRFSPDGKRIWIGGMRGTVYVYELDGKPVTYTALAPANDILGKPLALFDATIPDLTPKLWPVSTDKPGEIEGMLSLSENRLVNGDAEGDGGWQGAVAFQPEGASGSKRSLKVGADLVTQEISGYLGEHITWVLEFFYRNAGPAPSRLLAGVLADNDYPDSTARELAAGPEWRFARIAVKSGSHAKKLTVGFSAIAGDVLVDQVQFRRLRFPSINHMFYEPLHAIQPVLLDNPLYSAKYDPVGNLREQAPNRIMVEMIRNGALSLIESAFLQNGRLNDTSSHWYIQPLNHDPTISCGLKEPRWVSMVALYFDVRDPQNVTPHFDIVATDMETRKDVVVARVRNNGQLFRLVKFPPVKTAMLKIKFVTSIARLRTLTEIELYGPLSGREGIPGFGDAEGQNTYMGDFTRVDKRKKALPPKLGQPLMHNLGYAAESSWNVVNTQILAAGDRFFVARGGGKNNALLLEKPAEELYWGRAGGIGYTPYGALYGGLLLRSGLDGKLYCINPDSGNALWTVPLGTRLFGSAVAISEDVYAANETGKLFQLDLANGNIMRETPLPSGVFGCPATDGTFLYFITDDGFLRKIQAQNLTEIWKTPVASGTDSTPAVDGGVIYLADQKGTAMAVSVSDGKVLWATELGDEFCRCPVVGPTQILFGCRGGTLAALNRADGKLLWSRKVKSRFYYEPLLFDDGRVLYFNGGAAMLASAADGTNEAPLQWFGKERDQKEPQLNNFEPGEPAMPLTWFNGRLFVVARDDHDGFQVNYAWHVQGGRFYVLSPWKEEEKKK